MLILRRGTTSTERGHWHWSYVSFFAWLLSFYVGGCHSFAIYDASFPTTLMTRMKYHHSMDARQSLPSKPPRTKLHYRYSNTNDPMTFYQQQRTANDTVISNAYPSAQTIATTSFRSSTTNTITTLDDFYNIIQECRKSNTLLVVHWSAPWCRSCQRIAPLLHRTMQQLSQKSQTSTVAVAPTTTTANDRPKIRYVNIPLVYSLSTLSHYSNDIHTENKSHPHRTNLHAMFEIRTVPYCHIYHPTNGLVQEFALTTATSDQRKPPKQMNRNSNSNPMKSAKTVSELQQLLKSYLDTHRTNG